jgi:kynureninase
MEQKDYDKVVKAHTKATADWRKARADYNGAVTKLNGAKNAPTMSKSISGNNSGVDLDALLKLRKNQALITKARQNPNNAKYTDKQILQAILAARKRNN